MTGSELSRDELHSYWRAPGDANSRYDIYAVQWERSAFLLSIIDIYAENDWRILEVGCGVGRNLQALQTAGYIHLEGIDISSTALSELRRRFVVGQTATLHHGPVEEIIRGLPPFDAVFTMAVLEHIHPDSEWVFQEVARITKRVLITIEDERTVSKRHFPRKYLRIFKPFGMRQVKVFRKCPGLPRGFIARVMLKVN